MVYLLHFAQVIGDESNKRGQAQHYIGSCENVLVRLSEHRAGRGAAITQYLVAQGIEFECVRVWPGAYREERRLKNRKDAPRLCPVCNPGLWARHARGWPVVPGPCPF